MNNFVLQVILAFLFYGLYGKLVGKLDISLPTYGYNFAIVGFAIVSALYCFFNRKYINAVPTPLKLFSFFALISILLFPNNEDLLKSICCVIVPLVSYMVGAICFNNENGWKLSKKLISLYVAYSILSWICLKQLIISPDNLALHRDFTFCIIFFIPFFSLIKNKILKIGFILILLVLIVISVKRSILMGFILFYVVLYLSDILINERIQLSRKVLWSLGLVVVIYIGFSYFAKSTYYDKIDERITQLEEDGGSGRDRIYENVYTGITDADTEHLLFGHGYKSVDEDFGILSHNDLLEIGYDFGIVPLIIWVCLIIYLFRRSLLFFKAKNYRSGALMLATLLFWQLIAETNCIFITPEYYALIFLFLGIINQNPEDYAKGNIS